MATRDRPGAPAPMYHEGARRLQAHFDSVRIADRLQEVTVHAEFDDEDRKFIEASPMFFLGTADAQGRPEVSYKGGMPGFVRVTAPHELAFPSYDGNGMFRSLGNILVNPNVHLLFIDFQDPGRLRVTGQARLSNDDPLLGAFEGAQLIVRVQAERIFPNCPRYIHRMRFEEPSAYAPRPGHEPPVPEWKQAPVFADALPAQPPRKEHLGSR